jgi:hypothetical protein
VVSFGRFFIGDHNGATALGAPRGGKPLEGEIGRIEGRAVEQPTNETKAPDVTIRMDSSQKATFRLRRR